MPKNKKPDRKPKNIATLKPTQRAIADASIRDALLAIVAGQGKPVSIPFDDLDRIAESHRLVLNVDRENRRIIMHAEKFKPQIITPGLADGDVVFASGDGLMVLDESPAAVHPDIFERTAAELPDGPPASPLIGIPKPN